MLRWIAMSAITCVGCAALGLGKVMPLASGVESFFLAMAALSGTILVGSYDAYETQGVDSDD